MTDGIDMVSAPVLEDSQIMTKADLSGSYLQFTEAWTNYLGHGHAEVYTGDWFEVGGVKHRFFGIHVEP